MIDRVLFPQSRIKLERMLDDLDPTRSPPLDLRFVRWVGRVLDDPVGAICRSGDHARRLAPFLEECGVLSDQCGLFDFGARFHTMGRMADKWAYFTDGFKETE